MIWMGRALFLARKAASEDEVPVGAVMIHQGKVVGEGYNQREKQQSALAHAEVLAIQEASTRLKSWRLLDCILYVTLEPCPMCLAACQQARVSQVIYGAKDLKGGALSLGYSLHQDLRTNHRFQATFIETPECGQVLTDFFVKKRSLPKIC